MQIITLDDEAFYHLLNKVIAEVKQIHGKVPERWIDGEEAMRMLRITSKTTLQKLRDEGHITFSPIMPKVILYDRESILEYIEKNAKQKFR